MKGDIETIYEDRRGRMKMKIVRSSRGETAYYSTIVSRPYKKEDDEDGNPVWEETHWLDEQDLLNCRRLLEIADDVIAEAKRRDSFQPNAAAA